MCVCVFVMSCSIDICNLNSRPELLNIYAKYLLFDDRRLSRPVTVFDPYFDMYQYFDHPNPQNHPLCRPRKRQRSVLLHGLNYTEVFDIMLFLLPNKNLI